jgi:hypothetical protein
MKLKLTLATIINIKNNQLDAFKCICTENHITLFLSTDSLKKAYDLDLKPAGFIRNTPVTDVQGFFDAVEEAGDRLADLFNYMEKTLEYDADFYDKAMLYEELLKQVDFNKIPKRTQFELFKGAAASIDESMFVSKAAAESLIKAYPKKQLVVSASRGFA